MRLSPAAVLGLVLAGCGGGATGPSGAPTPAPTPTPVLQPSPSPSSTPCPDGSCGNTKPVVRAQLRLYMLFDENRLPLTAPDPVKQVVEEPIPVGYTIRLDVTGKDANGDETDGRGQIEWFYDENMVDTDIRSPWQRDVKVVKPGPWTVWVRFDGVGSNDLSFTFAPAR